MRIALLTAAVLVIALAEADAQTAQTAQTRPYFTPEKAALACKARAGQQIAQDYGISASSSKPFDISETEEGWRIDGIYATDEAEQRRIDVACEVSGDGVEVTLSLSEKTSDSVE